MTDKKEKHQKKMYKHKKSVDGKIAAAKEERGVSILITGNGKGKTSSALGMALRSIGYGHKVGIIQFIKGAQNSGEADFFKTCPHVELVQMGTGFTWNTQDFDADKEAAERTWLPAKRMLQDESFDLVILDELTYMLSYKYLDKEPVLEAIKNHPREQSVVVTGRGGGSELREIMDTVSDIKDEKHAFRAGIKARKGVDY